SEPRKRLRTGSIDTELDEPGGRGAYDSKGLFIERRREAHARADCLIGRQQSIQGRKRQQGSPDIAESDSVPPILRSARSLIRREVPRWSLGIHDWTERDHGSAGNQELHTGSNGEGCLRAGAGERSRGIAELS